MFRKAQTGIIFLERFELYLYTKTSANILKLEFPPDTIYDLEIVSQNKLNLLISQFFKQNKIIPPVNFFIILSQNVYFQKALSNEDNLEKKQQERQVFLDNVPFENLDTKIFKEQNSEIVIAANRNLHNGLKSLIEKQGFTVEAITPVSAPNIDIPVASGFTLETAASLLGKTNVLKQNSFQMEKKVQKEKLDKEKKEEDKKQDKKKLAMLLSLFFFMIIILVILVIRQPADSKTPSQPPQITPTKTDSFSPSLSSNTRSSSASQNVNPSLTASFKQSIKIQMLGNENSAIQPEAIKLALTDKGYLEDNISIAQNPGSISSQNTTIVFSLALSNKAKEQIFTELSKIFTNVSFQESNNASYDVTIITGTKL